MPELELLKTGTSFQKYYSSLNNTYHKVFNKYLMLHYPFYKNEQEGLEARQVNLTNHCIGKLDSVKDKRMLEVGCGNGTQCLYVAERYEPAEIIGIDLNPENIELANTLNKANSKVVFKVDDAHTLEQIADKSIDYLICIESAFHYPDKATFLKQVRRVLKPDGKFLIADILSQTMKRRLLIGKWKRKMYYFHWTEDLYNKAFADASLAVLDREEITPFIIKGYTGYSSWINRRDCSSGFSYALMQIFMFVQVKLNVILLKRRRRYMVFVGN